LIVEATRPPEFAPETRENRGAADENVFSNVNGCKNACQDAPLRTLGDRRRPRIDVEHAVAATLAHQAAHGMPLSRSGVESPIRSVDVGDTTLQPSVLR
jgi:hypothetical protein